MPLITKITRQKNNPERYNIYIEDNYAFAVDESLLVKYQLSKDKVLEDWNVMKSSSMMKLGKLLIKPSTF